MRILSLSLTLLLFHVGLILAQEFDNWEELSVLGLGQVESLEYSPDDSRLAVGGTGGLRYFDTDSYNMDIQIHGAGMVRSVSWSPDGGRIVTAILTRNGGTMKVWDAETGQSLITIVGSRETVFNSPACWSPDGTKIAAGFDSDFGGLVKIWDAESGQQIETICTFSGPVEALAWSPDSRKLATGPSAGSYDIKIWDVETGQLVQTLSRHGWSITSIRWSPDGRLIASGALDTSVRI